MSIEIYKDIPDYEGLYQASNFGNIRRLLKNNKYRILKLIDHNNGYFNVHLCKNNNSKMCRLHRLILFAFVGPCPKGMECRHLDGNRHNNRIDNLVWGSHVENIDDRRKHGRNNGVPPIMTGSKNPASKLKEEDIPKIRQLIKDGLSDIKIGKIFNVSKSTISRIRLNITWRHA